MSGKVDHKVRVSVRKVSYRGKDGFLLRASKDKRMVEEIFFESADLAERERKRLKVTNGSRAPEGYDMFCAGRKCPIKKGVKKESVTGDPVLEEKIIETIESAPDLVYQIDPETKEPVVSPGTGKPKRQVSYPYFGRGNIDVPRSEMPVLETAEDDIGRRGTRTRKFLDYLLAKGVKIYDEYVPVNKLKPTQKEINGENVRRKLETLKNVEGKFEDYSRDKLPVIEKKIKAMKKPEILKKYAKEMKAGVFTKADPKAQVVDKLVREQSRKYINYLLEIVRPVIVSRDYHIVDGHHRWAAMQAWDFIDRVDVPIMIHVRVVNLTIRKLLEEAKTFLATYK